MADGSTVTRKRRWGIFATCAIVVFYCVGLVLGHRRLAWAAIKDLGNRKLISGATAVTIDRGNTSISQSQRQYLRGRLPESPVPTTPRIHVAVEWNAGVCARVRAGQWIGPLGAQYKDTLFVCVFGAWVPVYTYFHAVA